MLVDKTRKICLMNTKAGIFPDSGAGDAMETTRAKKEVQV